MQAPMEMIENVMVYVPLVVGAVIFTAMMLIDRQKSLKIEAIICVLLGTALLICPQCTASIQIDGSLLASNILLLRVCGVAFISSSFLYWFTRNTWDGTVPITIIMTKVFSVSLILLSMMYSHWGTSKGKKNLTFNSRFVSIGLVSVAYWLAGSLLKLLRSTDFSSYPQHNIRINTHLRVDSWLTLVSAVLLLAFPDLVVSHMLPDVKVANVVHLLALRLVGSLGVGSAITSLQATGFLHEDDKRWQFLSRILFNVMLLPFGGYVLWQNALPLCQTLSLSAFVLPNLVNAAVGYYAGGTIRYVPRNKTS